jgi:hypothetical protein
VDNLLNLAKKSLQDIGMAHDSPFVMRCLLWLRDLSENIPHDIDARTEIQAMVVSNQDRQGILALL